MPNRCNTRQLKRLLLSCISPFILLFFFLSFALSACSTGVENKNLTLATTTSVDDSGLLDYLKPVFEKDTGIILKIVAQGTGQAIKTAQNGDADVLLVHDKKSEDQFVSEGYGVRRIELMYNYYVIVGPMDDPAGIETMEEKDAGIAFRQIMERKSSFISRGDDSGTNKKELKLWSSQDITPSGDWYVSAGKGMGTVLSMADEKKAYTLTDKATYLSMKDKLNLKIVLENAKDLQNQYSVIAVNPDKLDGVNIKGAEEFINWITSDKALKMIGEYGKDQHGESLFIVNYKKE